MPDTAPPYRPYVAGLAAVTAAAVPFLAEAAGAGPGVLLLSLIPAGAGAWFGGWREAMAAVWVAAAGVLVAAPAALAPWAGVMALVGAVGCLAMRRQRRGAESAEAGLRRRAEELMRADERKDEALAILAHELRNPLAPIRSAADLLRQNTRAADRDRWLRIIDTQVAALVRLANDLLDLARIRKGTVTVERATTDLAELVVSATESCRPATDHKRQNVHVGVPPGGPVYADVDRTRITQVLVNLLNNASTYTPVGGAIYVSLDREPDALVVRVRDDGIGIDPTFLPHVWDMFAQHRTGLDRTGGGLGIGLTLVKRLVELHGGTVAVRSDGRDLGSEFTVRLPKPVLSWKNLPRPASAPPPSRTPRRILVVEDNHAAAETLAAELRMEGHAVSVVHDGPAALATADSIRPDAILLDIGLPGMDGYEIARRCRAAGVAATIIAVTGCATPEHHAAGAAAGIDHYLLKPVPIEALRALLGAPRPPVGHGAGYGPATVSSDTRDLVPLKPPG